MPHIINDLSVKLGKSINLKTRGDVTELDHRVLAKLKAPMVHLVRNACDHGIEAPEIRETANKPATGTVFLEARHEGDNIIVMVCDDGAGLAIDKIKQRAQANNLASAEALEEMSEEEIQSFIFKAGFSTKDEVSKVSGRGVGMDIVRTSLEEIGASVSVRSDNAKGTAFIIKAPRSIS